MKERSVLLLILALALGLRLMYVGSISARPIDSGGDEPDYDRLALNLASGRGYIDTDGHATSRRAPLTPAFFALIYTIFGHNIAAVRIAQALISALTCSIIYLSGKDIFSRKVGLLSAGIAAVYPSFIIYTGMLLTETNLIFLLVSAVYFLLRKNGSASVNYFLSGLLFGLAALSRPSILPLPFVIFFTLLLFRPTALRAVSGKALILIAAMLITISPWTIRNYHVHKKLVLVNTQLGYSLLASYFHDPKTGYTFHNYELLNKVTKGITSETERSSVLTKYTVAGVLREPFKFIKLLPVKLLWFWEPFDGKDCGFASSYNVVYGLVFLFFLFGLAGSRMMWKELLPIYAAVGYFSIFITLVLYGCGRYRLQIEPFIIILSSYGLFWAAERRRASRVISITAAIGLIFNLLFFLFDNNIKKISKKAANILGYSAFPKK